jgi:hypothetical protein
VAYDCPFSGKSYCLVIHNALFVDAMENNLIPPFLMREAGVLVSDVPKIHSIDPSINDHMLLFPDDDLRIHMSLRGIISYFPTRKPSIQEFNELPRLHLTPDAPSWDPHTDLYSRQEDCMLDWEGNVMEMTARKENLLLVSTDVNADDDSDFDMQVGMMSSAESSLIDQIMDAAPVIGELQCDRDYYNDEQVSAVLTEVSRSLDSLTFAQDLTDRCTFSKIATSIGSMSSDPSYVIGAVHSNQPKGVDAEQLAKIFRIDLSTAKNTLNVTTQRVKRSADPSLSRNYDSNDRMLRYKRINEHFFMDTFYVTKKAGKSLRGNACMQIFVTDKGYVFVQAMKTESEVSKAVKAFTKAIGAPDAIICDGARAQVMGDTKAFLDKIGTTLRQLERNTPWSNRAELYVGLVKEAVRKDLKLSNCPLVLWDYCAERVARVNNVTAKNLFQLDGQTPHFTVTGEEGDISNLCQFAWYDWCYYREESSGFPFPSEMLGRVLGPALHAGNEMSQWVLNLNGKVVPRRTCRPLKVEEINSPTEILKRQSYDECIKRKLGDSMAPPPVPLPINVFDEYEDDDESPRIIPEQDSIPFHDELVNAEVRLPQGDAMRSATVLGHFKDSDGTVKGRHSDDQMLNTLLYDVEFPNGEVKQYAANLIAENMYSQVDSEGFQYNLLHEIIDHQRDESAVSKEDMYIVTNRGAKRLRQTTVGWKLLVVWRDGSDQWIPLKDLKESNPLDVADYAKANRIDDEAAFKWWVPFTLRKRDRIIASVNARVRKTTHKYGIEVPTSIKHALEIDKKNGNHFWRDAIDKEMKNVSIAFEILEENQHLPPGYTRASAHIIFDVKMDFTRKARWVLDGHRTPDPEGSTYAGVVSRESVRIALTYAALNGIDVMAADIQNAYLQAPSSQKHYIICGLEFGLENVGKRAMITRALYGGKTAGRDFRNSLRSCMQHLGFESCLADPDVWMRPAVTSEGNEYWEYVLLYVDDALVVSANGEHVLRNEIGKYFDLKEGSIGPPKLYLGGKVSQVTLANGMKAWSFSSSQYVHSAVKNVEDFLETQGEKLPARAATPLSSNYRPEIDVTDELGPSDAAYYQSLIGILRWMVELGRVDLTLEVSMMSSHLALPREGHLQQLYHIFAHLKRNHNSEMVFDPSDPEIDMAQFPRQDWSATEFGDDLIEEIPLNAPASRGHGFVMRAFVDADLAGDTITRRSRTGFLVYLNMAPIFWLSKKQNSVETSTFGSEFMAMKHCTEYIRGLRYKLRMMGIPCGDPTFIYGDNQSVLCNTSMPDSTLKKKSNSIAYHFIREGCARDEWRTAYINTHDNPADLLTKPLPAGEKRRGFIRMVLYHLFGEVD